MADFNPQKIDLSNINNGVRYEDGDGVSSSAINNTIEAAAYAQEYVEAIGSNAITVTETQDGNPAVYLVADGNGYRKFAFANVNGSLFYVSAVDSGGDIAPDTLPESLWLPFEAVVGTYSNQRGARKGDLCIYEYEGSENAHGQSKVLCVITSYSETSGANLSPICWLQGEEGRTTETYYVSRSGACPDTIGADSTSNFAYTKLYDNQRNPQNGDILLFVYATPNASGNYVLAGSITTTHGTATESVVVCTVKELYFVDGKKGETRERYIVNQDGICPETITTTESTSGFSYEKLYDGQRNPLIGDTLLFVYSTPNSKGQSVIERVITNVISVGNTSITCISKSLYFTEGTKGEKGADGNFVTSANITEVQASTGGGLAQLVAGETVSLFAFNTAKTADEMTAFFNSLQDWQDMGIMACLLVTGGSDGDVPLLMAANAGTFYGLFVGAADTVCVYASEPFPDMGVTESGWQNLTDGVYDFSATPWAIHSLSQESLWNGSIVGKSGGATARSASGDKTYNFSFGMSDGSTIDAGNIVIPHGLPNITSADSGKFLRVSVDGEWVAETVPSAEGGSF